MYVCYEAILIWPGQINSIQPRLTHMNSELRSLLLEFFKYDLTALVAVTIFITLDEGSDTFILVKRKDIVRFAQVLHRYF